MTLFFAIASPVLAQQRLFVDAKSIGPVRDGTSWATAYVDLQQALAVAGEGDEIWVAAGTYTPGPSDDSISSFQLRDGVALYGGFAGGETSGASRDRAAQETILSGDVGGDDEYGPGVWYDGWNRHTANSGHVVDSSGTGATTILDGFTITAGATGPAGTPAGSSLMYGSGLYNVGGSPTVRNCTFLRNLAAFAHGGAVYNYDGSPVFENCRFVQNWVHLGQGGGIYSGGASGPVVTDCAFVENRVVGASSEALGAGISHWSSLPLVVTRCVFDGNVAENFYASGSSYIARGAGIHHFSGGLTVVNSIFRHNRAHAGAGIYAWDETTIINSLFHGNVVTSYEINTVVSAGDFGAAIASSSAQNDQTTVRGCTVVGNRAGEGAGLYTGWSHHTNIENSIVWGNVATGAEVSPRDAQIKGSTSFTASLVEALFYVPPGEDPPNPNDYPGCMEEDPMLVNSAGYDFRLLPGSPAVNAGDESFVPALDERDLDGHARLLCGRVDIGASEFGIGDVDCNQSVDLNDFTFWSACSLSPIGSACEALDFDGNALVDLADFSSLQNSFRLYD